jgi:hypothetical protein
MFMTAHYERGYLEALSMAASKSFLVSFGRVTQRQMFHLQLSLEIGELDATRLLLEEYVTQKRLRRARLFRWRREEDGNLNLATGLLNYWTKIARLKVE